MVIVILLLEFTSLGIWTIPVVSLVLGLVRNLTFTPIYAARCLNVPWDTFYKAIFRGCMCVSSTMVISVIYRLLHVPTGWIGLIIAAAICGVLSLSMNIVIAFDKAERTEFIGLVRNKLVSN